jgi:hypothetical protein
MSNNQNEILNIPNYQGLITTNNIGDVEDNDKLKLKKNNHYYDINENTNDSSQIQTELSSMMNTSSSNINEDEQLDKDIDVNQKNKLESPIIKEEQNNFSSSLLYGNSINDLTPKHIGKLFAFFYINQKPLILIGPDCKIKF